MRVIDSIFDIPGQSPDSAVSKAEIRRLGWHLENLQIVRLGRFWSNVDELVKGKTEKRPDPVSV